MNFYKILLADCTNCSRSCFVKEIVIFFIFPSVSSILRTRMSAKARNKPGWLMEGGCVCQTMSCRNMLENPIDEANTREQFVQSAIPIYQKFILPQHHPIRSITRQPYICHPYIHAILGGCQSQYGEIGRCTLCKHLFRYAKMRHK